MGLPGQSVPEIPWDLWVQSIPWSPLRLVRLPHLVRLLHLFRPPCLLRLCLRLVPRFPWRLFRLSFRLILQVRPGP